MNGEVHARGVRKERRECCNYTLINIFNKNKSVYFIAKKKKNE